MTEYKMIELERRDDGIAIVSVNRPKRLNALNEEVLAELFHAATALAEDDDLRAVIFTGAGDRAFVAGADIAAMSEMSAEEAKRFGLKGHQTMSAIANLPVPTLAAVNGFALGGGLELAISCDLIYLADSAKVGLPEVGLGIIPGFGGTQRLGRLIGWQQARRLVFTGATLNAEEAFEIGLALGVFPGDALLDAVIEEAQTIAQKGPVAVRQAKEAMRLGSDRALDKALDLEVQGFAGLWETADRKEGMQAFLEKRSPDFRGQ